jgi:hypothetical protein
MTNELKIKIIVFSQILNRSITIMNVKYYNKLFNKIVPTYINMFKM